MLMKFKIQFIAVLAIFFCLCATVEAEELDPIATQYFSTASTKNTIVVPIEKLRPSEKVTPARIFKDKKFTPLDVIERGDGNYTIIDGNKTFAAMIELGAKNLPVIVHPYAYQKNVHNIKELYALNMAAEDEFNNLMKNLQTELGGELFKRPTIKKEDRVREKAKLELKGDYSAVTDLWAASLYYPDEKSLLAAFDKLKNRDDVIWFVDRWNNPLPQGYKDVQLNLILSNGAIVELQLHHNADRELNYGLDHDIYEFRRSNWDNPAMKIYVERALNVQKILYAAAWDGRYAEVDESAKKLLAKTAEQLSTQKSARRADILLKRLERILKYNLPEEYNAAA